MGTRSFVPAVVFALAACTGTDRLAPGAPIGTFHVTSKLVSTSCGPVPDPWEFDVRLRFKDETLYWVQGDGPISGVVASSRVEMQAKDILNVRAADPKTKTAGCSMQRDDVVTMALATADQKPGAIADTVAFVGTLRYRFAPTAESDCLDQLSYSGGDYEALPCEVAYEIAGAKK